MNCYLHLEEQLRAAGVDFVVDSRWQDFLGFDHTVALLISPIKANVEQVMGILALSRVPFLISGGMCNSFYSTYHYSVIVETKHLKGIDKIEKKQELWVAAGEKISTFSRLLSKFDERASAIKGIPGTVGGAVMMNAGAFGISIADFIREVRVADSEGTRSYSSKELYWGYRRSIFENKDDLVILAVRVGCCESSKVMELEDVYQQQRFRKVFLEHDRPNLGSTMITKNIYADLSRSIAFKRWQRILKTIPVRIVLKLYTFFCHEKLTWSKRVALCWILLFPRSCLSTIPWISEKTLNTFCFDSQKHLSINRNRFLKYVALIRLSTHDMIKEEIRIL
jgi:UDP-N-acetylenolpyruvoylglucosamine reductase